MFGFSGEESPKREQVPLNTTNTAQHITRCWHEWEIDGSERRITLCVETALELRPGSEGFNAGLLDELVREAAIMMHACSSPIDTVRIIPQR